MKIYTFQPNFVWEQIKNNGFYYPPIFLKKILFLMKNLMTFGDLENHTNGFKMK